MIEAALAKSKGRVAGLRGSSDARYSAINAGIENQAPWNPEAPIQHSILIRRASHGDILLLTRSKARGMRTEKRVHLGQIRTHAGQTRNNDTGDIANDHYHRYNADVAAMNGRWLRPRPVFHLGPRMRVSPLSF